VFVILLGTRNEVFVILLGTRNEGRGVCDTMLGSEERGVCDTLGNEERGTRCL
jgi:hypothetical protein